ncbi:ATP-binding protein [Nocardioides sp. 1609]|uniref:ATP-binding protein n=1 Tax=Nocardioides sp. 1609 TaxID=2508327 RepID=UPI00106FD6F7|nr:ATP-binding protein [Nocardioides sp. 1609]
MRERLAAVAGQVARAAEHRGAGFDPAVAASLAAVVEVLCEEYGGLPTFEDPWKDGAEPDRASLLTDRFGLDGHEVRLLVTVAAGELDLTFAGAYDLLGGRPGHGLVTAGLALELCGLPTATAAGGRRLAPSSTLRRTGLIEVAHPEAPEAWLNRLLRVPDRVRRHLLGEHAGGPEPDVERARVQPVPVRSDTSREVARAVQRGARLLHLHSWPGAAGIATAAAGLEEVGLTPLVVDVRVVAIEDVVEVLRRAVLEAALTGGALVVTGGEVLLSDRDRRRLLEPLDGAPVPVVLVAHGAWHPRALSSVPLSLAAPHPTGKDRERLWREHLGAEVLEDSDSPPVSTLRLTPEEIAATAGYARTVAARLGEPLSTRLVREAARAMSVGASRGEGDLGRGPVRVPATFADLVLPDHTLGEIKRIVRWASRRDDVIARTQVHGKAGKGTGLAALLTGNPGTGKTLAANVVADELNLELMQVDLSSIVDKYIGETEKNLEKVFAEAESRDVVLFFDEADALFGSRSVVNDARDRYANQEISYLLQRIEHFNGITVMATNLRGNLDAAFSRRMQFIVHFPDPDEPTRRRLWEHHLTMAGALDPDDPVDVAYLARTLELAGGDVRNVILGATYDAAWDEAPIGMRHVWAAVVREHRKLSRIDPVAPPPPDADVGTGPARPPASA